MNPTVSRGPFRLPTGRRIVQAVGGSWHAERSSPSTDWAEPTLLVAGSAERVGPERRSRDRVRLGADPGDRPDAKNFHTRVTTWQC